MMLSGDAGHVPSPSPDEANIARAYNYLLGGKDARATDRLLAERMLEAWPRAGDAAVANRKFIERAVRYLVGQGVTQFIDIGAGLPCENNVHEVAQALNPAARVIYVDNDPAVVSYGNAILASPANLTTHMVEADMRETARILNDQRVVKLIDFQKPVAVLFVASLHFLSSDEDPYAAVAAFRDAMAPGSHLVISHGLISEEIEEAVRHYNTATRRGTPRTLKQIAAFFDGFTLLEPGLVPLVEWRQSPDHIPPDMADLPMIAGVGRKPSPP